MREVGVRRQWAHLSPLGASPSWHSPRHLLENSRGSALLAPCQGRCSHLGTGVVPLYISPLLCCQGRTAARRGRGNSINFLWAGIGRKSLFSSHHFPHEAPASQMVIEGPQTLPHSLPRYRRGKMKLSQKASDDWSLGILSTIRLVRAAG